MILKRRTARPDPARIDYANISSMLVMQIMMQMMVQMVLKMAQFCKK